MTTDPSDASGAHLEFGRIAKPVRAAVPHWIAPMIEGPSVPVRMPRGESVEGFMTATFRRTVCVALVAASAGPAAAQICLAGDPAWTSSYYPDAVAVVDVDLDGDLDVLAPSGVANNSVVSLLRNLGDGTFAPRETYAAGAFPRSIAVADFTGDGYVDVMSGSFGTNWLALLTNTGLGTFNAPTLIPAYLTKLVVRAADLDGDGDQDVVAGYEMYPGVPQLSLHMNQGSGAFGAPIPITFSGDVVEIELGDLDGDGAVDIVLHGYGAVQFLRNLGAGTFAPPQPIAGAFVEFVLADLDGDSDLDIATTPGNAVRVVLNLGGATFAAPVDFAAPRALAGLQVGDIDGDGDPDLVAVGSDYPSELLVFANQGAGAFAYTARRPTSYQPYSLELADMDGDGDRDFVVPSGGGGTVTVHANHGAGTYTTCDTIALGSSAFRVTEADLNGDGQADLLAVAGGLRVLLGQGQGVFAAPVFYDIAGTQMHAASVDLDGDGDQDVVTANQSPSDLAVLLNPGNGVLAAPTFVPMSGNPRFVLGLDVDGDGDNDLVTANSGTSGLGLLLNTGTGVFGAATSIAVGPSPYWVCSADLDGDGDPDLASANFSGDSISVVFNQGGGTFSAPTTLPSGFRPTSITSADFDGDGDFDLAVCNRAYSDTFMNYSVRVYRNSGTGTFTSTTYPVGALPLAIGHAELDGQPGPEIFTVNSFGNSVSVLRNLGNGTFAGHQEFVTGGTLPQGGTALDIDEDGDLDILTADSYGPGLTILRNCLGTGMAYCLGDGSASPCPCGNFGAAGEPAGCLNSLGLAGRLAGSGVPRITADTFALAGSGMPNSTALYFQGTARTAAGLGAAFGDGLRCVGGSVVRLGTKLNVSNASGYPEGGDPPISVRGALPPDGGSRHYQVWYRNAAAFCTADTFNLTNGLTAVWAP